jgi:hypothetical protein
MRQHYRHITRPLRILSIFSLVRDTLLFKILAILAGVGKLFVRGAEEHIKEEHKVEYHHQQHLE